MLKDSNKSNLEFTGNWFIDAGILGFVNLMEEVYGEIWKKEWKEKNLNNSEWKFDFLDCLNKKTEENKNQVYYKYFPLGYLFYHSKIRIFYDEIQSLRKEIFGQNGINQKIAEVKNEIKKLNANVPDSVNEKEKIRKKLKKAEKKLKLLEEKKENKFREIEDIRKRLNEIKIKFANQVYRVKTINEKTLKSLFPNLELKLPAIARNFYLFNSKEVRKNPILAYKYLLFLCQKEYKKLSKLIEKINPKSKKAREGLTYEIYPDSTINPFLHSPIEFPNISYTKPLKIPQIEETLDITSPLYIFLLCFEQAFDFYYEGDIRKNILFYTNNLKFCYRVNKRLKIKKEIVTRKSTRQSLFRLTFSAILDELVENKSYFSLENMYIVEYEGIENQKLVNVEYIGIPKLQASVLLDDYLREILNTSLQIQGKNFRGEKNCWLLEEFIKGKPLYPLALQHVKLKLTGDIQQINYSIFYALLIDAAILEFKEKEKRKKTLFSENFFETNYREILKKVKMEFRKLYYHSISETKRLIPDDDTRKRLGYLLLDSLYGNDKARFLNILLKAVNSSKENINPEFLDLIFEKIVNNDKIWQRYALFLVAGMISDK